MNQQQWQRVEEIVDTALSLDQSERGEYIREVCKGNQKLKTHVTELLKSIEQASNKDYLEAPDQYAEFRSHFAESGEGSFGQSLVGKRIDNYHITNLIGHGGMGSVFRAERADEAYEGAVALKIMRRGMDTPANIARFRRERNILAGLDHPKVARLLDGGVTDDGLPYLVMEYVEGLPLYKYCNTHRLSIEERLNLFQSVCGAVQHAHQNAVIHRDLKPSNILVTAGGQVKILDFGIAKLLEPEDPEATLFQTRTGARMFTLEYAAPEQVEAWPVTTATDTYALGILLYELLTGTHPFDLDDKNLTEIEKLICEQTPAQPSQRFSNLPSDKQKQLARRRNTTSSALTKKLKGDLDAIVMKALRKEPEARYPSAEQFLEDLRRREHNQPIIARKDTIRYKSSKFLKRHKAGLAVAVGFLLLITGFVAFYTWQITKERNRAQIQAKKAEAVSSFLVGTFRSASPESSRGDTLTAIELLDRGAQRIDHKLEEQPTVQARVRVAVGRSYLDLGRTKRGLTLLQNALEQQRKLPDNVQTDTALTKHLLGHAFINLRKYEKADNYFRSALAIQQKRHDSPHPNIARNLSQLAMAMHFQGKTEAADSLTDEWMDQYQMLYQVGSQEADIRTAEALYDAATFLIIKGSYEKAASYLRDATAIARKQEGPGSPLLSQVQEQRVYLFMRQKKFKEAERLSRKALRVRRDIYGKNHMQTGHMLGYLAESLEEQHRYKEAEKKYRKALAIAKRRDGKESVSAARARSKLADLLHKMGDLRTAKTQYEEALAIFRQKQGRNDLNTIGAMNGLGAVLQDQGRYSEAEALFRRAYAGLKGRTSPNAVGRRWITLKNFVQLYEAWNKPKMAEKYRQRLKKTGKPGSEGHG